MGRLPRAAHSTAPSGASDDGLCVPSAPWPLSCVRHPTSTPPFSTSRRLERPASLPDLCLGQHEGACAPYSHPRRACRSPCSRAAAEHHGCSRWAGTAANAAAALPSRMHLLPYKRTFFTSPSPRPLQCSQDPGQQLDKRCHGAGHSTGQSGQRAAGLLRRTHLAVLQASGCWCLHLGKLAWHCQAKHVHQETR